MPLYNTRHLQASIDIPNLGGRIVQRGEKFGATDVDANYLIGRKMAVEIAGDPPQAEGAKPPATPTAAPIAAPAATPTAAKPGRPAKPATSAPAAPAAPAKSEAPVAAPAASKAPARNDMLMTAASVGLPASTPAPAPVADDKAEKADKTDKAAAKSDNAGLVADSAE